MLSDIQAFIEWVLKTFGTLVGMMMAFLVPYWAWKKEAKNYDVQKRQASTDTGKSVQGIAQAFVMDSQFTDRIVSALRGAEESVKQLSEETAKSRRQISDTDDSTRELKRELEYLRDSLKQSQESYAELKRELVLLRKSLGGSNDVQSHLGEESG